MSAFHSYIGDLAQYLVAQIKGAGITQNVYVEGGPNAVQSVPDNFCIVTFPLTYRNKGPFQLHNVRVEMVAKDMENGRTDILSIEEMANKYLDLFPIHSDRFTLSSPYIRTRAHDGLGHHSWTIQCMCMVNTTDKYPISND